MNSLNLLNEASDSKFVTRRWKVFNDQSNANYDVGNETIYNTEVLKSDLWDYKDAYITSKGLYYYRTSLCISISI